jgi:hypothetical protein
MVIQFALFNIRSPLTLSIIDCPFLLPSFSCAEEKRGKKGVKRIKCIHKRRLKKRQSNQYLSNHNLEWALVNGLLVVMFYVNSGDHFHHHQCKHITRRKRTEKGIERI